MVVREKDMDGEGEKFGQQFFRVFMPQLYEERLKIPPAFHQYLQNQPTGMVSLKAQSGNTWLAELASDTEGLFFGHGWKEFVVDHSLEFGHFLTFRYDGCSQFSVVVFDGMCIEKPSAFHAKPCMGLVIKIENDEADMEISAIDPSEIPSAPSTSLNRTKDSDSSSSMQEESISCNKSAESMPLLQRVNKAVPKNGKSIMASHRKPTVISQRPPITEEQKKHALQKAKRFKSKNPFVLQIMKESYVYVGFFMRLPCEFVRRCLPRTSKNIKLWDPQGKAWEVNYIYYTEQSVGAFSGGWRRFSLGNYLEKFDVCVFELLSKDNIKVHIYRVVPEITSFLPLEERNANRMKKVGEMGMNDSTLKNLSTVLEKGKKVSEASVDNYKVAETTSLNMDMNAAGPSEVMVASIEKSCIATRKRVREMDTDGSTLKKFSNVSEKSKEQSPGASIGTYKLASTSLDRTKDSNSSSSMQEESISCNKSVESMPLLQRVNKDVPKNGKSIMASHRQPTVISQRLPITEEQKNHALQRAKRFKSKNPFVLQIMKETYVYVGFFMRLPCEFVRKCLPRTNRNIKLWDPQRKAWEVNYIYYKEQSYGAFSGGWKMFSLGNYLEKFDVCVFELLSKDNIKVHIYRVVPEITSFLPGSNSK